LQPIDWIEIVVFIALGLVLSWFAGVFRRKSIIGPRYLLPDRATPIELLIPALFGFCASIFAPALYFTIAIGKGHQQPTSHQTVCMYAIEAAAGLLAIQAMDFMQNRNNLRARQLPKGVFAGVVGACAVIPLVLAITLLVQGVMKEIGASPPQEHSLLLVFQQPSVIDRLLVILSAVILAPLFEELVFRAHLQSAIRRATTYPWVAVVIASVLFALVHEIWWMMPPLFVLAVGLGYVYERTRNIWATIFMHSAFNALSLTVEYISMKHH
jgi:membrane protease YdiL (CAAX protease family)